MKQEENVYGKDARTGQAAEAEEKEGPAVLGKFKTVNALAEAYSALQAEFTRRSQRLKELEKKADNAETPTKAAASGAEAPIGQEKMAEDGAEKPLYSVEPEPVLPTAETAPVLPQKQSAASQEAADKAEASPERTEELYRAASGSEEVRLKIIGDYLLSLKNNADAPLMRGGTGALAVPVQRARSVADAGEMALRYFKKDNQA